MSDDEDALLIKPLPRNLKERKYALEVRTAEVTAKTDCTEKNIWNLICTIGLTSSVKGVSPIGFKILAKLFIEKYPVDETEPEKVTGITDFAIRSNPIYEYYSAIGQTDIERFEIHTLKQKQEDNISWKACFEGPTSSRAKLISAMKLAVHSHPVNLEKGKETWSPANLFIEKNTLPVLFTKNQFNQWIFREEDMPFMCAWISYYDVANTQPCYKCHPELRNKTDADGWTKA